MKPKKLLKTSLDVLNKVNAGGRFTLDLENELLNGYEVDLHKTDKGFTVGLNFKPYKGFSSTHLNSIKLPVPMRLTNDIFQYFLPENSLLFSQYSPDFTNEELIININGTVTQISTSEDDENFDGKFLRLIIPVKECKPRLRDIQGYTFDTDVETKERHLIKVQVNNSEYHFFQIMIDNTRYVCVDTTAAFSLKEFQKVSHNILNAFGFLFGDLFLDEGFLFSSVYADFKDIQNVFYSSYRESLLTGLSIYTTNPYSIYNVSGKTREEIDQQIAEIKKWYEKIHEIDSDWFSNLSELFHNNEPISRAAIIALQGNIFALEMKGSAYSAALEAITSVILKENKEKYPKPIDSKPIFNAFRTKLFDALNETLPDIPTNETARKILKERINNINKPTNASKLQKSFEVLGYNLKPYELSALKARDKFQHGELPVDEITDDAIFRKVYYICLIMHRLIYILVLKRIGFDGYIINYPQLHSHITQRDLGEDLLYKI